MAKFYVGQRVRILYSIGWPELAGQEGTVVCEFSESQRAVFRSEGANPGIYLVSPDPWGTHKAPRISLSGDNEFSPYPEQLEPIVPDGWKTVAWSECLWMPEHLREMA